MRSVFYGLAGIGLFVVSAMTGFDDPRGAATWVAGLVFLTASGISSQIADARDAILAELRGKGEDEK